MGVGQQTTHSHKMEMIRVSTKILVVILGLPSEGMILTKPSNSGLRNRVEDFNPNFIEYYDYEEPLPQGPTRRPPPVGLGSNKVRFPEEEEYDYYYDYEEEEPLPQGPTREPPLPSGPTRRPGQPTTSDPHKVRAASPAVLQLPLLTTKRPRRVKPSRNPKTALEEFGPFKD